jgi:polysaccharide export outer membrane protein
MRNHSSVSSSYRRAALLWIGVAVCLVFIAPALRAQCTSAEDAGLPGCPGQLQQQGQSQPGDSAAVPVPEVQRPGSPTADLSTAASANNSLFGGASYTEDALRDGQSSTGIRHRQAKPEAPTEFQRFVAATTGQMLPIYGANLFLDQTASFAPVEHAPAPADLVISAGDELRIRIWGQVNFSANLRVSREGEIYLPKAGEVHVSGLPFSAVAAHLRNALERVYRNFDLSVDLGEIHSIQVYVTGHAQQPGECTVSALSTLVDAVFLSGGPSGSGSMRHIQLKREGKVITDFDLYALLVKGDKTGDAQLQPGDVLYIPATGPEVALLGSVRQTGIYELRGEETIDNLLDAAGGRTAIASGGRLSVERIDNHAQRSAFELSTDHAGLATLLADGDIVRIDSILSSYRETVTLRGSVANPGRFRWHEGMHLSELMPDRDSLMTRDYWWRRTQLGLPAPEFTPSTGSRANHPGTVQTPDSISALQLQQDANRQDKPRPTTAENTDSGAGATLASTDRYEQINVEKNLLSPGVQTDWNYAVIERVDPKTMTPSLIPFDLGKLVLHHDPSQNDIRLPIEEQTKYVWLEGEFAHPGVYSVQSGESLRSLIARAGGLTAKAYLFGSDFTRKSTQELEQKRLSEYADRLEHQLARDSISLTAQAGGGTQGAVSSGEIASINRELIARLRQYRPTGRIVLDLHPHSTGADALPEMALENGDRLMVPSAPDTVQVIGAVLNQNSFLYRDNAKVGEYLHLAGGPSREADRGQSFVLRADGSVTSHDAGKPLFASGFDNLRLYPGDTIVVPEKRLRPGAMREFLAWSQLFSQLSLGAAAVDVIK